MKYNNNFIKHFLNKLFFLNKFFLYTKNFIINYTPIIINYMGSLICKKRENNLKDEVPDCTLFHLEKYFKDLHDK